MKSDVPLEEKCPQCGNNLVLKNGRFGEFTACSTYPKCKFVKQKTIGVPCTNCTEGEGVKRRLKAGPVAQCPNGECKFKKPLVVPVEVTA